MASDRLQDATPSPTPSTVLIGDPAPPPHPSIHTGDWRNKGIFPDPGFIWQKPAPKASLYKYGMEGTATPLILNLVQLIHWLPYVPAIMLAAHISTHAAQLQANCGVLALQVRPFPACVLLCVWFFASVNRPCVWRKISPGPMLPCNVAQVFCLMMAPVTQVFGSVMGIVMHEYVGWQVTEFKSPTVISDGTLGGRDHTFYADNDVSIYTNNNEWLR